MNTVNPILIGGKARRVYIGGVRHRVWIDGVEYGGDLATEPPDIIVTEKPLPAVAQWNGITYGNGVFVVVSRNTPIAATSPDGITWTQRTMPRAGYSNIAFGNGLFIAVGQALTTIATSPDGITWTQRPGFGFTCHGIAFGNGIFVAAGYDNTNCATSVDGITWTVSSGLPSSGSTTQNYLIAFGNGRFVLTSTRNFLMVSVDGHTWEASQPVSHMSGIAFGNGIFVATGYFYFTNSQGSVHYGDIVTSVDGFTWQNRVSNYNSPLYNVAFGDGIFMVTTYNGAVALVSSNGNAWDSRAIPSGAWYGIAYGNGVFVSTEYGSNRVLVLQPE